MTSAQFTDIRKRILSFIGHHRTFHLMDFYLEIFYCHGRVKIWASVWGIGFKFALGYDELKKVSRDMIS